METSLFLGLPAEIRDQIYGYLLSTKYTKHYPREEDPEWEYNGIMYKPTPRPTHCYHFHFEILRTNRQINQEASSVLYSRNMFVELRSEFKERAIDFAWLGVPIIAQGAVASRFVHTVLRIELKPKRPRSLIQAPLQLIFAGADLPAFCKALVFGGKLLDPIVHSLASFTTRQLKSLLEPLRLLHSFRSAHVAGPLDEQYKTDLCLSISRTAPSFEESLSEVLDKAKEGDAFFNAGESASQYVQAINIYNGAMVDLKTRCSRLRNPDAVASDPGPRGAYIDLLFKLRVNLATAHFRLGQYRKSEQWSQRATDPTLVGYYHFIIYRSHPRYAEACVLNAHSNRHLGRWEDAIDSMEEAVRVAPHLEPELKALREDERRYQEGLLRTVRIVLARCGKKSGGSRVMRYPGDFEEVKGRLLDRSA